MQALSIEASDIRVRRARIRSLQSSELARIAVRNRTQRKVEVLWINYESKLVRYKTLDPDALFCVTTFKTHPWIFREFDTGQIMHVNHRDILWPDASTLEKPIHEVWVHFPVLSLKMIAVWKVIENIQRINDIDQLELPALVLDVVRQVYRQYYIRRFIVANGIDSRTAQPVQPVYSVNFSVPVSWIEIHRSFFLLLGQSPA